MLELQTQIYIVSGALVGAAVILIIWQIILSVKLNKLKNAMLIKSPEPNQGANAEQLSAGIPRTYIQYPPPVAKNQTETERYPERGFPQSPVHEYDPPLRHVLGPQVLPHSPDSSFDLRGGRDGHDGRNFQMQARQNPAFVDDSRPSNRGQSKNAMGGGYGY